MHTHVQAYSHAHVRTHVCTYTAGSPLLNCPFLWDLWVSNTLENLCQMMLIELMVGSNVNRGTNRQAAGLLKPWFMQKRAVRDGVEEQCTREPFHEPLAAPSLPRSTCPEGHQSLCTSSPFTITGLHFKHTLEGPEFHREGGQHWLKIT